MAKVRPGHLAILRCSMARIIFGIPASRSDKDVVGLVGVGGVEIGSAPPCWTRSAGETGVGWECRACFPSYVAVGNSGRGTNEFRGRAKERDVVPLVFVS